MGVANISNADSFTDVLERKLRTDIANTDGFTNRLGREPHANVIAKAVSQYPCEGGYPYLPSSPLLRTLLTSRTLAGVRNTHRKEVAYRRCEN